jgi:cephalosporin hydroxylase
MSDIPSPLLNSIQKGTMAYKYRGVPMLKNPFDLAIYPLLLNQVRPRTLIEVGSHRGGSAMWFADIAASLGVPIHVYSVDIVKVTDLNHPSVTFLEGNAQDLARTFDGDFLAEIPRPLFVIEDSDHHFRTCLSVLKFFDRWLSPGEYIVVEDGILSDMLVADGYEGGPVRAINEFLRINQDRYVIDRFYCDYFGHNVTWNIDGYLRRI